MTKSKTLNILFVVPCTPYFPSGIVRVAQFFPMIEQSGYKYEWFNFNSPRVQCWLHWLDLTIINKIFFIGLVFRAIIHATGIPYRWFRIIHILLIANSFDLIFFQSILMPVWATRLLKKLNPYLVFDFDDAIYIRNARRVRELVTNSWQVIVGSHELYNYATQYSSNVILIPSSVTIQKYQSDKDQESGRQSIIVGWIGGTSTMKYLSILEEPLNNLASKGYDIKFLIAGSRYRHDLFPRLGQTKITEIAEYYDDDIPKIIKQMDIGVLPMWDGQWERGKCALKAIIYMAGGIPIICSPVGENNFVVRADLNGYLAKTPEEWEEKLEKLIINPQLRMQMGNFGKNLVSQYYTSDVCYKILETKVFSQKIG